ncbi:sensor histidine kinase [Terrabacter sp. RAF57]|uniref:sensor histidine kinase n=1 Tax=Terrabacter sp. RAF57 TaxID=3233063 RepID=UPI003F9E0FE7
MTTRAGSPGGRTAQAHAAALERLRHQRDLLRPLGWAVIAVVAATALTTTPTPGLRGAPGGVTLALAGYAATTAVAISDRFLDRPPTVQVAVIAVMGVAGVGLVALQPRGATGLAVGAAVWMAMTRLPLALGVVVGVAITVGQDIAALRGGATAAAVLAATLLNALLGLVAYVVRAARAAQDHTELLLAQLAEARDEQSRAAALAERGRIAAELHDVLAHCLSGAAIQLQGARLLAAREPTSARVQEAIRRASDLVNDGLANARAAVGALRGERLPGIADLEDLVAGFRRDFLVPASLTVQGQPRPLTAETDLLLYRTAQEALTNIARYAPGAPTLVSLHYRSGRTCLTVQNRGANPGPTGESLPGPHSLTTVGGGHGLAGLSERLERVGGTLHAGPHLDGWQVDADVPA